MLTLLSVSERQTLKMTNLLTRKHEKQTLFYINVYILLVVFPLNLYPIDLQQKPNSQTLQAGQLDPCWLTVSVPFNLDSWHPVIMQQSSPNHDQASSMFPFLKRKHLGIENWYSHKDPGLSCLSAGRSVTICVACQNASWEIPVCIILDFFYQWCSSW